MTLNLEQPFGIESLCLAVGNARCEIAIADQNLAVAPPPLDLGSPLIAIGDVEQLRHVGRVVAGAAEGALDLFTDRRTVIRERQQEHVAVRGDQAIAQQLSLRLLAALIEPLEGDEQACPERRRACHVSSASTSSMV